MLLNDIFGGKLVVGDVFSCEEPQGYHWWNLLDSGVEIDVTRSKLRDGQRIVGARVLVRPAKRPRRYEEYLLLRKRVEAHVGPLPGGPE